MTKKISFYQPTHPLGRLSTGFYKTLPAKEFFHLVPFRRPHGFILGDYVYTTKFDASELKKRIIEYSKIGYRAGVLFVAEPNPELSGFKRYFRVFISQLENHLYDPSDGVSREGFKGASHLHLAIKDMTTKNAPQRIDDFFSKNSAENIKAVNLIGKISPQFTWDMYVK